MSETVAAPFFDLAHACTQDELCERLGTTTQGLTQSEVAKRILQYGKNQLTPKKKISPLRLYLQQYQNTLTIILLVAALLILFTYFFGNHDPSDLIEAGLIAAIVVMITLLGFFQEFKAEKAIESLKKMLAFKAKVLRDNREQEVDVVDLVPGDVVILEEGEKVPADIRLLQVSALSVNEASLTGESAAVSKKTEISSKNAQLADQKNMAFAGTIVTSGRAVGIVVRTGDATEIGKIAASIAEAEDERTPIQQKLDKIGKTIAYIIIGVCVIVFAFIMFFAKDFTSLSLIDRILHSFVVAVALAVAAIPEGLAAVVTITLALGTQRMLKKNVLVRKLNAIETLGSTDVICSDKTGTLTKGEMTVTHLYTQGMSFEVSGVGYETAGEITRDGKKAEQSGFSDLLVAGFYCNNASLREGKILGDPTEAALLVSAVKGQVQEAGERVFEVPFTSDRKMMSVVVRKEDKYFVYAKGAPEVMLGHCRNVNNEEIASVIRSMSSQALRVLAFAAKELTKEEYAAIAQDAKKLEEQLNFLGLQGMIDPPRVEVAPLIKQCHASGIRVIMITGDHEETAKAVAKEIGIDGAAFTGEALDAMTDEEFAKAVSEANIYARVSPAFKMRIVDVLQKENHIVAMTGDGVNDAPALKKANIGIAMGITGTDVSKEASDIILLDDKFSTIVAAIEEGRGIYHNMRKFVSHLLTCNLSEVLVVFIAILFFQKLPLTAIMLLWINIVTDGLPAIALGLDRAEKGILSHSPKLFQQDIITKRLWVEMGIFGVLVAGGILGIFLTALPYGIQAAQGSAFTAIVFFESVMVYLIRSRYKIDFFSNKWLLWAILITLILQIMIAYHPFTTNLFSIAPMRLESWVYIVLISGWLWVVFLLMQRFFDFIGFERSV